MNDCCKKLLDAAFREPTVEEANAAAPSIDDKGTDEGTYQSYARRLLASRRARIEKPKTAEERVTVEEVHTTPLNYSSNCAFTVMLDGKPSGPLHSNRDYAEIYAEGLRARLIKNGEANG